MDWRRESNLAAQALGDLADHPNLDWTLLSRCVDVVLAAKEVGPSGPKIRAATGIPHHVINNASYYLRQEGIWWGNAQKWGVSYEWWDKYEAGEEEGLIGLWRTAAIAGGGNAESPNLSLYVKNLRPGCATWGAIAFHNRRNEVCETCEAFVLVQDAQSKADHQKIRDAFAQRQYRARLVQRRARDEKIDKARAKRRKQLVREQAALRTLLVELKADSKSVKFQREVDRIAADMATLRRRRDRIAIDLAELNQGRRGLRMPEEPILVSPRVSFEAREARLRLRDAQRQTEAGRRRKAVEQRRAILKERREAYEVELRAARQAEREYRDQTRVELRAARQAEGWWEDAHGSLRPPDGWDWSARSLDAPLPGTEDFTLSDTIHDDSDFVDAVAMEWDYYQLCIAICESYRPLQPLPNLPLDQIVIRKPQRKNMKPANHRKAGHEDKAPELWTHNRGLAKAAENDPAAEAMRQEREAERRERLRRDGVLVR